MNYQKEYYLKNQDEILKRNRIYKKTNKFKIILISIKYRCENPNDYHYKWYGDKGIECNITEDDLKKLWFRDKADEMNKPTIDRRNNKKHYTLENCRFIEQSINSAKDKIKKVLQYDLNGDFLREWQSINEISKKLNIKSQNLYLCLNNKIKTSFGFKWRYKKEK